jgi:hypothetical protein
LISVDFVSSSIAGSIIVPKLASVIITSLAASTASEVVGAAKLFLGGT